MDEKPFITFALLVRESAHLSSLTIDSVLSQSFSSYEVVVVEHGQMNSWANHIHSYRDRGVKLFREKSGNFAYLMNRALDYAKGEYIQYLYPGDHFLFKDALKIIHETIQKHREPLLFYTSALDRSRKGADAYLYPLDHKTLSEGRAPTRLHACFFKMDLFKEVGVFNERVQYRALYDTFLRIHKKAPEKISSYPRVFVDYEHRHIPYVVIFRYGMQTVGLIFRYFGLRKAIIWWFIQDNVAVIGSLFSYLKSIFIRP